ncbi:hypothetical protein [Streptomyces zagrosensis]|uniref:Regulator component n=1 Tax=Streptomyces zagrosensis TaxID=1042984 RepID=A0A7W9QHB8_9ACTN|nr:hypothetical protein [Streptomyces zagrosensis]MBB5940268.1 hypothetical protein [Streptomyces zagrosensis]
MPKKYAQLHQRCQPVLDQLSVPNPFTIDALCQELSVQRRRPLHLHPLPQQDIRNDICGMWLATETDDHIFFEQRTSRVHQEHIVLHEIGHMLFDHWGTDLGHSGVPQTLLPDLSPQLVQRLLGRASYTNRQEQEAEMLASLLRLRASQSATRSPHGVLGRLEAALGTRAADER